jgi:hypothetical protein
MRNFEQLNNEKITPYFLSLAKKPHHSESLLDVRRDNGENFDNAMERDTYIRDCSRHGFLHQRMNANGSDTK